MRRARFGQGDRLRGSTIQEYAERLLLEQHEDPSREGRHRRRGGQPRTRYRNGYPNRQVGTPPDEEEQRAHGSGAQTSLPQG